MTKLAQLGPYELSNRFVEPGFSAGFIARFSPHTAGARALNLRFPERASADADALDDALIRHLSRASKLNHINLAQVFDAGRLENRIYVASEFIDGVSMDTIVDHVVEQSHPVPHDVAAFLVAELCAGLAYAHGRRDERGQPMGIVHGNIQPSTVMVSRAGEVKLVDFGFTQARENVGLGAIHPELRFQAPEVAKGGPSTVAADIYAVGVLAWTIIGASRPWTDVVGDALKERVITSSIPSIKTLDSSVPDDLARVIDAAVSANPAERPRSATELRSALSTWLRSASPGFGRHRLKAWMQKEMSAAYGASQLDKDTTPLHRKEFKPADSSTVIHASANIPDTFGERPSIASLLTLSAPAVPARRAQPAGPRVAPGPGPAPLASAAPPPTPAQAVFAAKSFDADLDEESVTSAPPVADEHLHDLAPLSLASAPVDVPDDEIDPDEFTRAVDDSDDDENYRPARPKAQATFGPWIAAAAIAALCAGGWYAWVTFVLTPVNAQTPTTASVFVTSRPQGASIIVDGQDTGRSTPALIPSVDPGTDVTISIELQGYRAPAPQSVEATAVPQNELTFQLEPQPHTIRIDSEPAGVTVVYAGEAVGLTPYTLGPLSMDYRTGVDVVLRQPGYFDDPVAINWEAGASESSIRRTLQPDPAWIPPEPVEE
jgi:serine/threonine-protein kinase